MVPGAYSFRDFLFYLYVYLEKVIASLYPILFLILVLDTVRAQISYSPVNVWSHNDYDQSIPLYNAFNQEVGFY